VLESRVQGHLTETIGLPWYALRSKPRREESLWQEVRRRGFSTYYPRLRVRPVNPRARKTRPYFPGYLFVQADLSAVGLVEFQWMPHALGLVCFGDDVATVSPALVHAIWKRVGSLNDEETEFGQRLRRGDRVLVREGPLAGYQGVFDARLTGQERVRVLLSLLQDRYVAVELSEASLERPPAR
jgi:transcription antitermination factor NusG